MHILESYALSSGSKIDKPYIYEKIYPLPFDKYIILANFRYKYYQEVIDIIYPKLKEKGIRIVHLSNSPINFNNVYKVYDFDPNQSAYLIKKSVGCVGESSFFTDLASLYNKKTVCLYSNTYMQNVKPYWHTPSKLKNIESDKGDGKPSFNTIDDMSLINSIKPENIAKDILEQHDLEFDTKHETIFFGVAYSQNFPVFDLVPDEYPPFVMDTSEASIRMDLNHDEDFMLRQLQFMNYDIYSNKPISEQSLLSVRGRIKNFFYIIEEDDDPTFVELLTKLSIDTTLISRLSDDDLTKKKINYMDYDPILHIKTKRIKQIKELENENINDLSYLSNKIIIDKGLLFPSEYAWANMLAISTPEEPSKFVDNPTLIKDLAFLRILKRTQ
jgi:hypothetical protein